MSRGECRLRIIGHAAGTDERLFGSPKTGRVLLHLRLSDFDTRNRQLRIKAELQGTSDRVSSTKLLLKGQSEMIALTPPLRNDFKLSELRADRNTQLIIRVTALDPAGEHAVYEKSYPVTLLPRDTLLLSEAIGADYRRLTFNNVAAWITPNARSIDVFLARAKERNSGKFTGTQSATVPQVKALWDELHEQGMSYVMDPAVLTDTGHAQRTRLPSEVLMTKNAQCLEGTVLFATLMEAIGIEPLVVVIPGHAFVGWKLGEKDPGFRPGDMVFLETTAVHTLGFEAAVRRANARMLSEVKAGHFKPDMHDISGVSFILDISALRSKGYKPQPVD